MQISLGGVGKLFGGWENLGGGGAKYFFDTGICLKKICTGAWQTNCKHMLKMKQKEMYLA